MKRVAILGSTGSIGAQTLDVIAQHSDRLQVVALAANRNLEALQAQAARFGVKQLALFSGEEGCGLPTGMDPILAMVRDPEVDIVVVSVSGVIGLLPTLAAIEAGKHVALASKEVLVAAGELVMPLAAAHNAPITPIDSEHSAIFQCLQGAKPDYVDSIILTASGGPFRGRTRADLESVTQEQALNHPTWRMGGKITIDSATLMNKALELIEARWLFGLSESQIEVVVHPQSVVHSMVRFKDGSVLGQMGFPDMRLPISYALLYPDRIPNALPRYSPVDTPDLHFEPLDNDTFPAVSLARQCLNQGKTYPAAFNAANEEAVKWFLCGKMRFTDIERVVRMALDRHEPQSVSLDSVVACDEQTRIFVRNVLATS